MTASDFTSKCCSDKANHIDGKECKDLDIGKVLDTLMKHGSLEEMSDSFAHEDENEGLMIIAWLLKILHVNQQGIGEIIDTQRHRSLLSTFYDKEEDK